MNDTIKGVIGLKIGDKITTDHIMPAGSRLKYRSNIPAYSKYVFEGLDPSFSERTIQSKSNGIDTAIVGGLSYGQGSSREHAAICPAYLGVKIVIAKSFERIHSANLINFGIVPMTFVNDDDYNNIKQGDIFLIEDIALLIKKGADVFDITINNQVFKLKVSLSERQRAILVAGGLLNYTKRSLA